MANKMTEKPQESAEQAANEYILNNFPNAMNTTHAETFITGAKWQQAKDAATIAELREALKFYADKKHFEYTGHDDFEPESVSGEPTNWLCGGAEGSEFTVENGCYARMALEASE